MSTSITPRSVLPPPAVATGRQKIGGPGRLWSIGFWLIVATGLFFRFYHIDQHDYWCDESFTSITISGHPGTEFKALIERAKPIHVSDLRIFQQVQGPREKCLEDLVSKGAEHPPLYYGLERLWAEQFGCSILAIRMLPVLLSLMLLPAAYWLVLELFQSRPVACAAVALIAVSPLQVLYAQNAREYPLWQTLICVGAALLLRSLRHPSFASWSAYAATTAMALYTFPLTALVSAGQALCVLLTYGWRRGHLFFSQICALAAAGVLYIPWLIALQCNSHAARQGLDWLQHKLPAMTLLQELNHSYYSSFVDPEINSHKLLCSLAMLAFGAFALLILIRQSQPAQSKFILCLIGASTLPLLFYDLIRGTSFSTPSRYLFPSLLGITFVFAFAAVTLLQSKNKAACLAGGALFASLIGCGVTSCLYNSTLQCHRLFQNSPILHQTAEAINQSHDPLFVMHADLNYGQLLTLCRLLRDDQVLYLVPGTNINAIPSQYKQVLFYMPYRGKVWVPLSLDLRLSSWDFGTISRRDFSQ